jgi:MoaD family protein
MIKIKVKFFAYFRELFGGRERELVLEDGLNLAELLKRLIETPQQKAEIFQDDQLKAQVVVMINGSVVAPENLAKTRIEDGAVIALFPMMGGG